jgi:hypothetical protein
MYCDPFKNEQANNAFNLVRTNPESVSNEIDDGILQTQKDSAQRI